MPNNIKTLTVAKLIPAVAAAIGAVAVGLWLSRGPDSTSKVRGTDLSQQPLLPVDTSPADPAAVVVPSVPLPGLLVKGDAVPAEGLPGSWPNFRGPNHDGISPEKVRLLRSWPDDGPKVLWSVEVGDGYAGPAVARGRVYLLDYDVKKKADALRCLSLADGREIWRRWYSNPISKQHGYSRTVPAVTDKYVVTLGPSCHVMCVDADTGEFRWGMDLAAEYGATVPEWYAGQCPLIDDGKAIIALGGKALMIAVDCQTGNVLWETPNPHAWKMTHSSVMPMTFNGRRMYAYCATSGIVGVAADTGEILWEDTAWQMRGQALCPSPVILGDGRLFLSGGYGAGSMMLQLIEANGTITTRQLYKIGPRVLGSEQQTPILYEGHIYGVNPDGKLVCLTLDGELLWDSGDVRRFSKGYGPYMIADGLLFVMGYNGLLALAEATPAGYRELARAKVVGKESWGPMAPVGGRLIVRDINRLVCLDVRAQ
ncbi:MAG TPA: PQQ-binding-like beta-propeller repeat protein [Phycisphaerae bacterium]|nr:PQQ-binding-like beta-propeller repeat protein [Phycisphaerae bacterium]